MWIVKQQEELKSSLLSSATAHMMLWDRVIAHKSHNLPLLQWFCWLVTAKTLAGAFQFSSPALCLTPSVLSASLQHVHLCSWWLPNIPHPLKRTLYKALTIAGVIDTPGRYPSCNEKAVCFVRLMFICDGFCSFSFICVYIRNDWVLHRKNDVYNAYKIISTVVYIFSHSSQRKYCQSNNLCLKF